MKEIKRKLLRIFFVLEIVVFTGAYFFAPQGLCAINRLKQENEQVVVEINDLRAEIAILENTIAQWHSCSFYKEKIAREQLQMARKGDRIYYTR